MFILFKLFSIISGDFPCFIFLMYFIYSSVQTHLVEALCKWLFHFNSSLFNCFSPVSIRFFYGRLFGKTENTLQLATGLQLCSKHTHTHKHCYRYTTLHALQVCKWQYIPYFLRWNFLIHFDHFVRAPNDLQLILIILYFKF